MVFACTVERDVYPPRWMLSIKISSGSWLNLDIGTSIQEFHLEI